jgi:hypothetical protein
VYPVLKRLWPYSTLDYFIPTLLKGRLRKHAVYFLPAKKIGHADMICAMNSPPAEPEFGLSLQRFRCPLQLLPVPRKPRVL